MSALNPAELDAAHALILHTVRQQRRVYACGNGGSAATASHLAVDLGKTASVGRRLRPRVVSLTDNVAWLTAVANDISYDECFAEPLRSFLVSGDLVIAISASGESENVVRAFEIAGRMGAARLALVGCGGGRLAESATVAVHVDSRDYGVIESVHLAVVHLLVRLLQQSLSVRRASPLAVEKFPRPATPRPVPLSA